MNDPTYEQQMEQRKQDRIWYTALLIILAATAMTVTPSKPISASVWQTAVLTSFGIFALGLGFNAMAVGVKSVMTARADARVIALARDEGIKNGRG